MDKQKLKALVEKWNPVIEGQGKWEDFVAHCPKVNPQHKAIMAQLFENIETLPLQERTDAGAVGDYKPILIPMLRRVMPSLIGNEIFGTQPLTGPTGLIFALRAVYGNDSVNSVSRANSVILTLATGHGLAVGDSITGDTSGATGTVRYVEDNNVLVEVASGTFQAENANTAATSIAAVYENEALFNIIFKNYTGPYATADGEKLSTDMKEVGFDIQTGNVKAETRKLKAKWTEELEQDLKAVHNMDAETLLSAVAADEITMEMNREFINKVHEKAVLGSSSTWTYDPTDDSQGRWENEKYQALCSAISRKQRAIAVNNKRGQANWMIVSPAVLSALENAGKLSTVGTDPVNKAFAGTAMGMKVFCDIYATDNYVLLGYKGSQEIDAGIFYSPYIGLQVRKGYGEEDGQPRTFFSTRYALTDNIMDSEKYFGKITVEGLPL
jgi:hypothetical protein